jgi:hypothetical protein
MKTLVALGAASMIATLGASTPAQAREGCGPGFHRARNGMCRANRGTRERWIEGHYYSGRGYWYRNRWYHHRRRNHRGVWIYL